MIKLSALADLLNECFHKDDVRVTDVIIDGHWEEITDIIYNKILGILQLVTTRKGVNNKRVISISRYNKITHVNQINNKGLGINIITVTFKDGLVLDFRFTYGEVEE